MNVQLTDPNILLLIAGILAILVELILGVSMGFDLFLVGIMMIIGAGIGLYVHSFIVALCVVIILSLVYVFLGRKFIQEKLTVETKSTNVENIIQKKAIVTKKITNKYPGQVKIEGEIWRASSKEDIDVGESVVIQSVSGVTLYVVKGKQ